MNVLVTGASGQLGSTIVDVLSSEHELTPLDRAGLDLTDLDAVSDVVDRVRPEVIINAAAYNDVDGAEDDPQTAFAVNAFGVRGLARAARRVDATLVHYSTDFVFDGDTDQPYTEDAPPNPQSVYAMSKLVGEWFASDVRAYVLRVESLFGGRHRAAFHSSLDRMARAMLESAAIEAFSDRVVSPSYVDDVVGATAAVLRREPPPGLYHCVGSGWATWLEVATELGRCLGRAPDITPIRMADRSLRARRPAFCALSNQKLATAGITMPSWQDALGRYARHLRS